MTAARVTTHTLLTFAAAIAAAIAVASVPRAATAQRDPSSRAIRIGIGGGVAMPVGDFKNGGDFAAIKRDFRQGVAGQGYVELRPPGLPLGFRAAVSYNRFDVAQTTYSVSRPGAPTTATTPEGYTQILGALGNVTLQLPTGPIRPYVLAGIGAFSVKDASGLIAAPAGVYAAGSESTSTNFGVNGGAGLLLRLGRIEAFAEARIANVYTKQDQFENLKSVQYVPITFGLSF